MKRQIFSKFKHYRNNIIKSLFEVVKEAPNKKILLDKNFVDLKIKNDKYIFQNHYKMLSIKNNTLLVHYFSGEGIAPPEYKNYTDDIVLFSLDEIYNIVTHMKKEFLEIK